MKQFKIDAIDLISMIVLSVISVKFTLLYLILLIVEYYASEAISDYQKFISEKKYLKKYKIASYIAFTLIIIKIIVLGIAIVI